MPTIQNDTTPIGANYPTNTGRRKLVNKGSEKEAVKVAFAGDSTLDNVHWVNYGVPYAEKQGTVTHQTAVALASDESCSYDIANFAVDGATTSDLSNLCSLGKVVRDEDHNEVKWVNQLDAVKKWQPDVAVLSVAGNNYREALANTLVSELNKRQLLLRITPEHAKPVIRKAFEAVKETILREYKLIIDNLIANNPRLNRLVLLSQYYPAITEFTGYFIYTGFSHLARSEGRGQDPFTAVEETMNELYREILQYAATKDKEIIFVDVTSSLNPIGGNHTAQIEPNERGSEIMGRLIASAVEFKFPEAVPQEEKKSIAVLRMEPDEKDIRTQLHNENSIPHFRVKKITDFISESRYRHLGLLFSPSSNLFTRYESAYHAIMGKQFDQQYTGLFAFGLLDLSLITVAASYLWRVAVNDEMHAAVRVAAGVAAAPILLAKLVVGLAALSLLALPIYGYHQICAANNLPKEEIPSQTSNQLVL